MAKSTKSKLASSIEDVLQASKSLVIQNSKTVVFDNSIVLKIKNVIIDYPEQKTTATKLINMIVAKWLEEHREELMHHHVSNSLNRY
jgi:hypothetical protein